MSRCVQTVDWYCICTVPSGKYSDPLTFHFVLHYSLILTLRICFIYLHTIPPNYKAKTGWEFFLRNYHIYSVLCWRTFCSDYSLESSWIWRYNLGTPVFGEHLPFFSADSLKLCHVGWGALLHSYFQVSPEMLDWVQVWAGQLKDIQRPLLCFCCVLKVVVLFESETESEILSALE